jgi:hypothetical protein
LEVGGVKITKQGTLLQYCYLVVLHCYKDLIHIQGFNF